MWVWMDVRLHVSALWLTGDLSSPVARPSAKCQLESAPALLDPARGQAGMWLDTLVKNSVLFISVWEDGK